MMTDPATSDSGPFQLDITSSDVSGVTEKAVIEVEFFGQIVQRQLNSGEYKNEARYSPTVRIISSGKGFRTDARFIKEINFTTNEGDGMIEVEFLIKDTQKVTDTVFQNIVPDDISNNNSAQEILDDLAAKFKSKGINKALAVGSGLYLQDQQPFSVSTAETAVADVLNSQKMDDDLFPLVRVNTIS